MTRYLASDHKLFKTQGKQTETQNPILKLNILINVFDNVEESNKKIRFIQEGSLKWEIKCWKTEMNISNRKVSFGKVLKNIKSEQYFDIKFRI